MSQFSEHDYSTLECLLNHSWANKRWGEQLPRKIPIDTLGSMVEASAICSDFADCQSERGCYRKSETYLRL